jgi:hypothetical protein
LSAYGADRSPARDDDSMPADESFSWLLEDILGL